MKERKPRAKETKPRKPRAKETKPRKPRAPRDYKAHPIKKKPLLERFERFINPVPESGCWLWDGTVTAEGYGSITINYKTVSAHRCSWELHCGPVPDGIQVLHKCDIRSCVNPHHLFLGTQKDNMADMRSKGRQRYIGRGTKQ